MKRVVAKLKQMPMSERIQLLVKAKLMSQAEADVAVERLGK